MELHQKRAQFHIMLIFLAMSFSGRRNSICGSEHEDLDGSTILLMVDPLAPSTG